MSKVFIFIILSSAVLCQAQQKGYVKFNAEKVWVVQLGDSIISSDKILSLEAGNYMLKARPQISYNWPSIYVEDEIIISHQDTIEYALEKHISVNEEIISQAMPKTTSYSNNHVPDIRENSYLKTGLILGAVTTNWLSFYLKRIADEHYRNYINASSSGDIKKYKNKFEDYDQYSQITLGISTALLTGYIYFSLTE